jgi:hypothetical protein
MHLGIIKSIHQLNLLKLNQTIKTLHSIAMLRDREREKCRTENIFEEAYITQKQWPNKKSFTL